MAAAAAKNPPTLPEWDGHDDAVLLDLRCYVADRPNATTARAATSTGLPIQVTLHAARPPLLSYLCVHCPGLDYNIRREPRVVAAEADLVLLCVANNTNASVNSKSWDYFMYRSRGHVHVLELLPSPHPSMGFRGSATALLSRDGGAWYAVAAMSDWSPAYETEGDCETPIIRWDFWLHLYRSRDSEPGWITVRMSMAAGELVRDKLVPLPVEVLEEGRPYHKTDKTIAIGGERGTVAWVDLWRGVLICDVLVERPVIVRDIPLPVPARGNWGRLLDLGEPNCVRDVAISRQLKGAIKLKYIEMEIWSPMKVYSKAPDSYLEWVRWKRSVIKVIPGGWKARTWSMAIPPAPDGDGSSAVWQPDCELSVKDVTVDAGGVPGHSDLLSKLSGSSSDTMPTLQRLQMAFPAISIDDDDDIVYLASSTKHGIMQEMEFMVAIDVRNKTLRGVAQLDVKKSFVFFPIFCTSEICRYLSKSAGAPVQLKGTEKEAAKPAEKEAVKLIGKKKKGKPSRVHGDERTGKTRRSVNPRVMKTLEHLRAINWSCPRRLGDQTKDAETGDQESAC